MTEVQLIRRKSKVPNVEDLLHFVQLAADEATDPVFISYQKEDKAN